MSNPFACLVAAAAIVFAVAPHPALAQSARGGHPDFSGLYFPGGGRSQTPQQLPYTPAAKKLADRVRESLHARR